MTNVDLSDLSTEDPDAPKTGPSFELAGRIWTTRPKLTVRTLRAAKAAEGGNILAIFDVLESLVVDKGFADVLADLEPEYVAEVAGRVMVAYSTAPFVQPTGK